jgi:NTE family protein
LLSNDKFGALLIDHLGDKNIEDAPIPMAIIATDAGSGEKVILRKGSLAKAVMASTCIPGLFKPVKLDGRMLLDGGIVENVPIKTLRNIGAEFVIGVDLNANHDYQDPENILDVLLNSFHFIMQQAAKLQTENADLLIKPDLSGFGRTDISQIEDLMQKGYEDARHILNETELKLSSNWVSEQWANLLNKFGFSS